MFTRRAAHSRSWLAGLVGLSRRSLMAIMLLVIVLAVAAVMAWRATHQAPSSLPHFVEVANNTYMLPNPDALAEFELVKHDNTKFRNSALKGRWTFLIFGYTFCPDFCPTTLITFNEMHRLLALQPDGVRDVQFIMVSVDPGRDTPKLLSAYVPQFNPEFIGVTGDAAVIAQLASSVGAVYEKHAANSAGYYLVDHSSAVLLVNPQGRLQGVFALPHVAADMVKGFQKIRERAGAGSGPRPLADLSPLKAS